MLKYSCLCTKRSLNTFSTLKRLLATKVSVKEILRGEANIGCELKVQGWVRNIQKHKDMMFIHLNDGSCLASLQVVGKIPEETSSFGYGSCVEVKGSLQNSIGTHQSVELKADVCRVISPCDAKEFPLKKNKFHTVDYLREHLHLRPRTNLFGALMRVRNSASQAFHQYFQENGYLQVHTPILTSSDAEGAGEIFQVQPSSQAKKQLEKSDPKNNPHFFGVPAFLTVSGQLHLEVMSGAFSKVYTFSPTFRAENSRGRHHLSEFSMVEAEITFAWSIEDIVDVIESVTQSVCQQVVEQCGDDVYFFLKRVAGKDHQRVIDQLTTGSYERLNYTEAIDILQKSSQKFKFKVEWGIDLQKEHERYLVEHCGGRPVFVTDFPTSLKPFYARHNEHNNKTVAAVDLLAPGVGEICGGSLREDRLSVLQPRLQKLGLTDSYQWYLDLRRYGSAPHGGFGIGFERLIQTLLGIPNIKDTLPFPRCSNSCRM